MDLLLTFKKPTPARSHQAHGDRHVADGAPPGVYVPNMSEEDARSWKAKLLGSRAKTYVIELRTTRFGNNLLAKVIGDRDFKCKIYGRPHTHAAFDVVTSTNGPLRFGKDGLAEFARAVEEARQVIWLLRGKETRDRTMRQIRDGKHPLEPVEIDPQRSECGCFNCLNQPELGFRNPIGTRMVLCPKCGNERCPRATSHNNECTRSNELGQPGSHHIVLYGRYRPIPG